MQLQTKTVRQGINKAFLKEPVERPEFENFKNALSGVLDQIEHAVDADEHEEHLKNLLPPFFKALGFDDHKINTSGRIDLAIYTGNKKNDPVGVLMEVKRPGNKAEMITQDNFNKKALHEAVLYYLEQRIEEGNTDLKHVIITNMHDWFIFDAQEFERCFFKPSALRKTWKSWKADQKVSSNNDFMYSEIAKFVETQDASITGLYVPLYKTRKLLGGQEGSDYEKKLIPLFKLFTPIHLLKESFANDSNSLNREFYRELLYILGLEETTEGNTRYIRRVSEEHRNPGSLIENTIRILDAEDHLSTLSEPVKNYGEDKDDQLFGVALELCITWMNRVLFLKLLEAQLFRYHRGDKKFKFLNSEELGGFDALNTLFFQVLARRTEERSDAIKEKFGHIPYLNSSLFDVSDLEHDTTRISGLTDTTMPVYNRSVLNELRGKELSTLDYLFRFLEAFDFSAEGKEEIRSESKSLINASVLGLIFEKINGYKDGSFYTPGFITEYMARETLRKAVVDKFAEALAGTLNLGPSPSREKDVRQDRMRVPDKDSESNSQWHYSKAALPPHLIEAARKLRKEQTEAEELLWQLLRNRQLNGYKFRRQHPMEAGMILDFYCHSQKLSVEVDGGYHDTKEQKERDKERTEILKMQGIREIRFRNEEVLEETERVLGEIAEALAGTLTPSERNASEHPSPSGRGYELSTGETRGEGTAKGTKPELTFDDLYNHIGPNRSVSIKEANEIVNSITICDPAVGSGHFLVSCLNELLAIKSDLGILCDVEGKAFRDLNVMVENDELIVSFGDDELFEYDVSHTWQGQMLSSRKIASERQRIQQALFHEKRYLIENCLFGVDINANSVKICRLRLWIELLKRAFYTPDSKYLELEVLPNIDINIKQGNSLVSRFELDSDLSSVFKDSDHSLEDYKEAVRNYKHTGDGSEKKRLQNLIGEIKEEYTTTLTNIRPINKKLSKERGRLELMQNADLFGDQKFTKKDIKKQKKKVEKLEAQKADEESGAFYNQAFEWRFEFPEVLDEEGMYIGFDVVIGNPPYIRVQKLNHQMVDWFKENKVTAYRRVDISLFFFELANEIIRDNGIITFISSNQFINSEYGRKLREFIANHLSFYKMIDLGDLPIFEEAITYVSVFILEKSKMSDFEYAKIDNMESAVQIGNTKLDKIDSASIRGDDWLLKTSDEISIFQKVESFQALSDDLGKCHYGIISGNDSIFNIDNEIIDKYKIEEEVVLPLIRASNCVRYGYVKAEKFILYPYDDNGDLLDENILKSKYPHVYKYLLNNKGKLAKRKDSRKTLDKIDGWFKLTRHGNIDVFKSEKIIYPGETKRNKFGIDKSSAAYSGARVFGITVNDSGNMSYLLGCLNSSLIEYYLHSISPLKQGGYYSYSTTTIDNLPLPDPDSKVALTISKSVEKILNAKKENPEADTSKLEAEIDRLVYELYGLSEEEIGIVEGSFD